MMAPTSEERPVPTKKSLRIWVKNNGHVIRKKTRVAYVYPRTVEAAKDPFECSTGKNKMFYLIAINLFPDSKIVRPDDSDSEAEIEETGQNDAECDVEEFSPKVEIDQVDKKQKRAKKSPVMERTINLTSEPLKSHKCSDSYPVRCDNETVSQRKVVSSDPSKNSCQRKRLLTLKKTGSKKKTVKVENNEECSKMSDCENCISTTEPAKIIQRPKIKGDDAVTKGATVLTARKLPPVPTIMNSMHKIIETCSATGVVSFSLAKKKPRQSRS